MSADETSSQQASDEARLAKNKRIREAGIATRTRRATMQVKVFDLKIVSSSLTKTQKEALTRIFLEYKWLRNHALSEQRFDLAFLKEINGVVPVLTPNGVEERRIQWLGSQMQRGVIDALQSNLKALSTSKKRGRKVGKLKFVSECNSIDLPQFGKTHKLFQDGLGRYTKIRIQKIPGKLRVRGFEQLNKDGIEFANAKIVKKADGFHLLITTFLPAETREKPTQTLGVDFGISTQFTLSNGSTHTAIVEETERLKRLQRKLSRQQRNSNGYNRTKAMIRREYQRIQNRKHELANQLVHAWTSMALVYFQDENISAWKKRDSIACGSKKIHHGIMGRVKTLLQQKDGTYMLPKYIATTAWCHVCGNKNSHALDQRVYTCSCGYSENRDVHAAKNMIILGQRYQALTSGTEGSAGGEKVNLDEKLYAPVKYFSMKPETVTFLTSP